MASEDLVGKPAILPPDPAYYNQLQNATQQAQLSGGMGFNYTTYEISPAISMSGLETKVQRKITQAIDQLPMSICAHIASISFRYADANKPIRFEVLFDNQRILSFAEVDAFPAEEHIARIALECP
jgi:hypothetical protein